MGKKKHFLLIDTETTMPKKLKNPDGSIEVIHDGLVVDFGAVVVDKMGTIVKRCSVLVNGVFGNDPLFYIAGDDKDSIWSPQGQDRRFDNYKNMLKTGTRMLASYSAINKWLLRVQAEFDPTITAYNLAYDKRFCRQSGIDLTIFNSEFCLWHASFNKWANTKRYKQFVLDIVAFNSPTKFGNMSFKTNAETMARFVLNQPELTDEPHTALEDVIDYELPILKQLVKTTKVCNYMSPDLSFNWREVQVKNHFKPM